MHLNKLITFDMSFSYNMIKERNLKAALFSRNLDGYFSKVISVHPLAGLFNDSTEKSTVYIPSSVLGGAASNWK